MIRTPVFAVLLLVAVAAHAQKSAPPVSLDQMQHPGLLLKTSQPGVYLEAPTVATEISLQIRGIVARGVVRQRFENVTSHCVEALYVFPLEERATVDAMRMKVGERIITGEIHERQQAAAIYEQAKSEGKRASLLEQQRPNLFTVSVASLASGETAEIEIEFQQIVAYDDGRFSLRIPLAIGPRYTPIASTSSGTPSTLQSAARGDRNPVTLSIDLDPGIATSSIASRTHQLETIPISGTRVKLVPRDVTIASDRDFELTWAPQLGASPRPATFTEVVGDERYTLLMLFPPDVAAKPSAVLPRETVFIIDTSGSMGGPSIEQAKRALLNALGRLRASDRFNVIEFNSTAHALFESSRRADRDTVEEALRWVGALESTGGTEMLGALQIALAGAAQAGEVRQVVFITDGQVGNESEVFAHIREHIGNSRLFTIGIGPAPNGYFMSNAARAGRGTFTHIGDVGEVEEKMTSLFRKLESPVLTNVSLQVSADAEVWPREVADLYAGEPLVVAMRSKLSVDRVGRVVAQGWSGAIALPVEGTSSGIAKLWARQKIDAIRDSVFTGTSDDEARKMIVELALQHHLVTDHTSLVAVDKTPANVDPKGCTSELVPINLPAGWGGIDGSLPQTGTAATLAFVVGIVLLAMALVVRR